MSLNYFIINNKVFLTYKTLLNNNEVVEVITSIIVYCETSQYPVFEKNVAIKKMFFDALMFEIKKAEERVKKRQEVASQNSMKRWSK